MIEEAIKKLYKDTKHKLHLKEKAYDVKVAKHKKHGHEKKEVKKYSLEKIFEETYGDDNLLATHLEKEIFAAQNQLRSTPLSFLPLLNHYMKNFEEDSDMIRRFNQPDLMTQEGI